MKTHGPWRVRYCDDTRCGWPQIESENGDVVVDSHSMKSERLSDDDAILISTAPELLEALEELLNYPSGQYSEGQSYDKWEAAVDKAKAVIAKANGEIK